MAMTEQKGSAKRAAESGQVQIDGRFVREQASMAVRQFFTPITAPFKFAMGHRFPSCIGCAIHATGSTSCTTRLPARRSNGVRPQGYPPGGSGD